MLDTIRGLVRPTVAWVLILSWAIFEAVEVYRGGIPSEAFITATAVIVGFYFQARSNANNGN